MAALSTTIHLVLRKIGGKMPEDFMGCKCQEMVDLLSSRMREVVHQCDTVSCPCWMNLYPCTSKCKCRSCANGYVVRRSGSSTEPGQQGGRGGAINVPDETTPPQVEEQSRGNWGFDLTLLPSSNPEHKQEGTSGVINVPDKAAQTTPPSNSESEKAVDTSSMTVEPPWMEYRGNRGFDLNQLPSSDTESEQEGTGGITNVPDKAVQTTPPSNGESEKADDTSSMTVEPPWMQYRGNRGFDLNQLPSSDTESEQEGTGGITNVPDKAVQTTPPSNSESEQADDTSSMTVEPPRMEDRGNRDFDLNQLPSSNTEPEQEGTGGLTNVPDKAVQTTPPSNSESEQADDTSSMTVEPPRMEDRGNRDFDLNQLPSSNTELAQADDTSSKDEEPAQGGEQDTESRDNRGLDQNKRRRSM